MARQWQRLEHGLILLDDYLHPLFGATPAAGQSPFRNLKEKLADLPEGYDSDGRSFLARRLLSWQSLQLAPARLEQYDDHIKGHLDAINAHRPADERVTLKYFQQLALLYSEHVLDRVYDDRDAFLADLNQLVDRRNAAIRQERDHFPAFAAGDLTKLAYWMATGSGKTLLLHLNYYQILHYHAAARRPPFENILLITPNSGLSWQHQQELDKSGIPHARFRAGGNQPAANAIQIIEITKLSEKGSGPQTVHVDQFEGRNLIFVDEGHRGASGETWFRLRDKLATDGFTFEYSATFGEALNGSQAARAVALRQSYGKAIVFDYSYRYFYDDGYGKDYQILNLPPTYDPQEDQDTLLLANLLAYHEQMRLYRELGPALSPYAIERPLLVFVGHTVEASKSRSSLNRDDQTSLSDVLNMVRFFQCFTADPAWSARTIAAILSGRSGLAQDGQDIFRDRFQTIRGLPAEELYRDMLAHVCHTASPGSLHLANLKNAPGEIALRVGTADVPYGVVNIGNDRAFLDLAKEASLGLVIDEDALRDSLFETINQTGSLVNVLIGARKFTEGWSSWRVSGMGLLNVGKSEGSEIVQMFGRGVRLRGHNGSLKRSAVLADIHHPPHLEKLETLNIFSINGDYLRDFEKALEREGIAAGFEEFELPVQLSLFDRPEPPRLAMLRLKDNQAFSRHPAFALQIVNHQQLRVELDLRPRLQAVGSLGGAAPALAPPTPIHLGRPEYRPYLNLLDWAAIEKEMEAWRRQRGFHNLVIHGSTLRAVLLDHHELVTLYAPEPFVKPQSYAGLLRLQEIVLAILKAYAEQTYKWQQKKWEGHHFEYRPLDQQDDNLQLKIMAENKPGYLVKVYRQRPELVEHVARLIADLPQLYQGDLDGFPNLVFEQHVYQPLMAENDKNGVDFRQDIKTSPMALNAGEARFVRALRDYWQRHKDETPGRELYLLRNQSRGTGVGFFANDNFYPDFILWLVRGTIQRIVFIDPKGLALLKGGFDNPKLRLYHDLQQLAIDLGQRDITLDAFVISDKGYHEVRDGFGRAAEGGEPHTRQEFWRHHILFPEDGDEGMTLLIG